MYVPVQYELIRERETGVISQVVSSIVGKNDDLSIVEYTHVFDPKETGVEIGKTLLGSVSALVKRFDLLENMSLFNVRHKGEFSFASMVPVKDNNELNRFALAYMEFQEGPTVSEYLEADPTLFPAMVVITDNSMVVESIATIRKLIQQFEEQGN